MNLIIRQLLLAPIFCALPLSAAPGDSEFVDPFEEGMRQAFADYKKGDQEAVTAKLRELLKLMEEQGAKKVGEVLPENLEKWKGESMKRDDLAAIGGGIALSRTYVLGGQEITVKVVKDSPLVKQLLPFFANEELLRLGNRKTHSISGETAVMEGENKLQMVVDERIYVELVADKGSVEKDLVALARKLDLSALEKMK